MPIKSTYNTIALMCGMATAGIGGVSLVYWYRGWHSLTGIASAALPIAPNSALSLLLLGGVLCLQSSPAAGRAGRSVSLPAAVVVSFLCLFALLRHFTGDDFGIDCLFFRTAEVRGNVPVGYMSPLAASALILAAAALQLLSAGPARENARKAASVLAVAVASAGLISLTGYLYGTPLLYGGTAIPVSILAAVAFVVLGTGMVAEAGPRFWPVDRFVGPSIQARLMRTFLPCLLAFMLAEDLFHDYVFRKPGSNPALLLACDMIFSAVFLSVIVARIARIADRDIERSTAERRAAEKEIKESHERFLAVLDGLEVLVYVAEFETHRILFLNRYGRNTFGDITGKVCWQTLQKGQTGPCGFCTNDRLLTPRGEPAGVYAWEFCNTVNNRWYDIRDRAIRWVDGRMVRLEIAVDVTARKQMEEALKRERDRAQRYLDIAGVMIVAVDADQRVSLINKKGCEVLGCGEDEVIGRSWPDAFLPESARSAMKDAYSRLRAKDPGHFEHYRNTVLTRNGEERSISWHTTLLRNETGEIVGTLSSGEDITEGKRLEDQLRHAQKMEAVGQLAGGIAHDFNNILTAIMGYAYLLQMKMEEHSPLMTYVEEIINSAANAACLTQGLLAFSRKQIINPKPVRIDEIVKRMGKLLANLIGEDIELRIPLAGRELVAWADSGQVEQVIMNLVTNACDAMPGRGVLTITTEYAFMDSEFIRTHGYGKSGAYALISITDTGIGMDEKTKERIFEPFFTTKEVGKGTGLGLSIVFGIVKQHDGYITVSSEPGEGTTFLIYLPLLRGGRGESVSPGKSSLPRGGTETLLVVEDEEAVRKIVSAALEEFGYNLIVATDGQDALEKFIGYKDDIRLLLLDVVLPKKSGKEVWEEIRRIRPDMRALFMSGYARDILQRKGISEEEMHFIPKPVLPEMLLQKVREILDT